MRISSLSIPKDRSGRRAGDDSLLILPGICGVFDGATGSSLPNGVSPGQIASRAAAAVMAELAVAKSLKAMDTEEIFDAIRKRISQVMVQFPGTHRPSTTMAAACFEEEEVRIIIVGDSGVRINGTETFRHLKRVDDVSTAARIEVFKVLADRNTTSDEVEAFSRRVSYSGLDWSIDKNVLTRDDADRICMSVAERFALEAKPEETELFLRKGIQSQYRYANHDGHPFSYSTLNDQPVIMNDVIELRRPYGEIDTLEFFTDGYFSLPKSVGLEGWEEAFLASENADFHKTGTFPNIKGSTSTEFADDRSVIVLHNNTPETSVMARN